MFLTLHSTIVLSVTKTQVTALTYKFNSAWFQQVWFVLQDILSGVVDELRNVVYSNGASGTANH